MIDCVELLKSLIATPSFSREENGAADIVQSVLIEDGIAGVERYFNNVWAKNKFFDAKLPTLLLNSHIDTVKPSSTWTRAPFSPELCEGKLFGLGSNDAGASVVSLIDLFVRFYERKLPFNILLALTAEEEVMGEHGMRAFLPMLEENGIGIDMAIVGEPTGMQAAIAERGLVVLDAVTAGVSGHAARGEGINAIYRAIEDIWLLRNFKFEKTSDELGDVTLNITQIKSGTQHNVVPDRCEWVVDVRTTDAYSNEEIVEILRDVVQSKLTPRSTRVRTSVINRSHPLVVTATQQGCECFVSPTTSDMALMYSIPSLKIGPGQSARSHSADEYIEIAELKHAARIYENILNELKL